MENKSATIWHNVDHKSARIHGPWVQHEEHLQLITQARAEGREAGLREAAELRDVVADEIDASPMSSIHSALCEYRNAIRALIDIPQEDTE